MKLNEMTKVRIRKVEFLAVAEACKAIFWRAPVSKAGTFNCSGFSVERTFNLCTGGSEMWKFIQKQTRACPKTSFRSSNSSNEF